MSALAQDGPPPSPSAAAAAAYHDARSPGGAGPTSPSAPSSHDGGSADNFGMEPLGPPYESVLALVPALRARLAAAGLPADAALWGARLLDPDDPAAEHVLAK